MLIFPTVKKVFASLLQRFNNKWVKMTALLLHLIYSVRFVVRDGADSDSESYDGYYSSSFESYDSDDFEDYSTDEEDMKPPPVRSRTFIRCMDESDDDEIPEESNVESVEDTSRPVLFFSQRQKKTGEMVVKLDTKKAVAGN